MSNLIGKSLVFLQLALSLFALSWSAVIYLKWTDWGWVKPREELNVLIASEIDTRVAWFDRAVQYRDRYYPYAKPAQLRLLDAEKAFADNILHYDAELVRLESEPGPIRVSDIKVDRGNDGPLDPPGNPFGRPAMGEKIDSIIKSAKSYQKDLGNLREDLKKLVKDHQLWLDRTEDVTLKINGQEMINGKPEKVRPSLLDLRDEEFRIQSQAEAELEYLTPLSVNARKEADIYRERRLQLEKDLERVKKARER